jgi:hypothetical protein
MEQRWIDLASPDEAKGMLAVLSLARSPREAVAMLKDRVRPVKADSKRVAQLVGQLDHGNFTVRNNATLELEYYGKYIKEDLEKALKKNASAETNSRIRHLIERMPQDAKANPPVTPKFRPGGSIAVSNVNGQVQIVIDGVPLDLSRMPTPPPPPPGPPSSWVRAARAVTLLEHLDTPEARAILQEIAAGEADALPTTAARSALERLKR